MQATFKFLTSELTLILGGDNEIALLDTGITSARRLLGTEQLRSSWAANDLRNDGSQEYADAARNALKDPYSVREAQISHTMGKGNNNYVCACAITKNGFGGYTGRTGYTIFMNGDRPLNRLCRKFFTG
ncbi:hypothetical protein J3U99_22855 [Brucella pituitosa]|uniref:hypothetical protein n=1 Tax=Brucella pituitosa TaxID=571256 RepID=UPI0020051955|nr:hypothetical protein [Brucella pituitosa]MCK4207591.1 hypothetical protein [Brucella pituitosa]